MLPILLGGCVEAPDRKNSALEQGVGLELSIRNGTADKVTIAGDRSTRFISQLRIQVSQLDFPSEDALEWMQTQSNFSALDWTGLERVQVAHSGPDRSKKYQEERRYVGARWMNTPGRLVLDFADSEGELLPGAGNIELEPQDFMTRRYVAQSWAAGQPGRGDNGANSAQAAALTVTSSGTYTGEKDDVYLVEVSKGGPLDGTAEVVTQSVLGDDNPVPAPGPPGPLQGIAVIAAAPIDLGLAGLGAQVSFAGGDLVAGDRWVVRVYADTEEDEETVGAVEPSPQASFNAMAEMRLAVPRQSTGETFTIPSTAESMRLSWSISEDLVEVYDIPIERVESTTGPGFEARLSVDAPENTKFFVPGAEVTGSVRLTDGQGTLLHDEEFFPTYADFVAGESQGIQYYKSLEFPSGEGFFDEHHIGIMEVVLAGPKHLLEQNYGDTSTHVFVSESLQLPSISKVVIAGYSDRTKWDTPIPTSFALELPEDALPGTYVLIIKARRSHLGEVISKLEFVDIQVAGETRTSFDHKTGNCVVCHERDARLGRFRHGTDEAALCVACHKSSRGTVAEFVHLTHFLSPAYLPPRNDCSLCHLEKPSLSRASSAICGSCHQSIHSGSETALQVEDPYAQCGQSCHRDQPKGHEGLPPL